MYRPLIILSIFFLFIYLSSCAPVNYNNKKDETKISVLEKPLKNNKNDNEKNINKIDSKESEINISQNNKFFDELLSENIIVLISNKDDPKVVNQFLNVIEFAVYKKKIKNISFKIHVYNNQEGLKKFIENNNSPGNIYFGPISTDDTKTLKPYCDKGVLFFSFSSKKELADRCFFLLNFFLQNEIETIFNYFPENSKIAIVYPENSYGYKVSKIVDSVSESSKSVIINRASYKESLINVRDSIKELGKYELRKYELNRQKKLLALKNDSLSKKRLKKLERFSTTNDYDFTHVIIADYGLRLLQVAPLLAYYDIDPNIVRFVGTGAWDESIFFNEPSLQGAIFPGIEYKKRKQLMDEYKEIYEENLMRISTLPYDLVGLLSYLISNKYNLGDFYKLLKNNNSKFDGVDGSFYFVNNVIERDLKILEIKNGQAIKIN